MPLTEQEIRELLASRVPTRTASTRSTIMGAGSNDLGEGRRYLQQVADAGLAVPAWPARYGGRGASAEEAARIAAVAREFAVPDLYPYGPGLKMVGPTVLAHGTAGQQERWLRAIAEGREIWCQMFSEPDAGSDLANVATIARRDGDGWVLQGQKVWTSRGAYADWGICLARSDPDAPKHRGLTMFALRLSAPGVEVRPLRQMNGDSHFSEVFLEEAPVPDEDRIGDVGAGWAVALTVLAYERAGADRSAPQKESNNATPVWLSDLAAMGALANPVLRDRAVALYAYERAVRFTQERAAAAAASGRPGAEGSGLKLHGAITFKRRVNLLLDAAGPGGTLASANGYVEFLTSPSMSIRGGTDEIQRNIIGERVLGLPAEPRVDRQAPWSQSRRAAPGTARH